MAARRTDGYELAGADADDRGDRLLRGAAVAGLALIQAGVAGLFVSAWWRHVLNVLDAPSVGGVVWRLLTAGLFVWVLVAEIGALRRRRRSPVLVISLALAAMVGAILLETLAPF
ncbi:hypothetical protein [Isoptericola sp. NPDC057653]|jgi:hypothetical protein|uniref:hypothetical protein n=1 Tax=Isoptericola sp. NPDC057653 TaxID=3346195 RepID=UPI003680358C